MNVVRIMLHGLIALAPSAHQNDHHMTALLLDALTPHSYECASIHLPKLIFAVPQASLSLCVTAGCEVIGEECHCTDSLARKQVRLELDPPSNFEPEQAATEVADNNKPSPVTSEEAAHRFYVANLTKPPFNARLSLDYLAPEPPSDLFARMEIPYTEWAACNLTLREDQGRSWVVRMGLRKLRAKGKSDDPSQALAQMVTAQLNLEDGQNVKLQISDLDGANRQSIPLARGDHGYMIKLSNEPEALLRGAACDDGIARHFAHFYQLAENPPMWADRIIPQARINEAVAVLEEPEICRDPTFNLNSRPVCPMGSFIP